MTDKLITYEDYPDASGYQRKKETREPKSFRDVASRLGLAAPMEPLPEPEPKACPYSECENINVIVNGQYVARPLGWLKADGSGRVRRCQCLLDRIERAKPLETAKPSTPGKLFTREPIVDDPEGEL